MPYSSENDGIAMSLVRNNWLAITLTLVLAGLFFVLVSDGAEAVDYKHEVTISPASQWGEPEETLTYTVLIKNKGEQDDTYSLGLVSNVPTGWQIYILPSSITISDDSEASVTLYVAVGDRSDAAGGKTEQFTAYCNSTGSSNNHTVSGSTTVHKVFGTSLSTDTSQIAVDPNNAASFSITVLNDKGNDDDTITFSQSSTGTDSWSFALPGSETIAPDASKVVTFSVTPDLEAIAGLKSISFIATSSEETCQPKPCDGNKPISTITVTVKVNQLPALQIDKVGSSSKDVEAGKRVYYSFEVTNKGNAVDTFDMAVDTSSLPEGWDASLDQDKISNLGVDESINLTDVLVVKAPNNAAAESETSIVVTISSDYNSSINSTYTSRSTVLQKYDPKVSIVGVDTMSAKPEEQVNFTIKIVNDGNGEDDISLSLVGSNSSWGQLGDSAFTLLSGANDTTELRVTPPKDTEAKNGYVIVIKATSKDGETMKTRNIFINVLQIYEVSVQVTGGSSKRGDPGDELTYLITVKNKGNGDDTFMLTLEGEKASWASMDVDDVDLSSGVTATLNLTVSIDDEATVGDYDIVVRGSSEDNPTANDTGTVKVTVNKQFKVDVVVSSQSGDPGATIVYQVRIQNEGTGTDTFSVTIDDYPGGWAVDPVAFQVENVEAGKEEVVNISVSIKSGEDNKAFTINLTASSDEARKENPPKYVNKTVSLITTVNQLFWIDLSVQEAEDKIVTATVGVPKSVEFKVQNLGTGDDVVVLSAISPKGWSAVDFSNPYVNVVEGATATVTLSITVPDGTAKGDYYIDVKGVSDCAGCENGTKSMDVLNFTVKVELARGVTISADTTEMLKLPGDVANFTIVVKNTGDGEDRILLSILNDDLTWASLNRTEVLLGKDATGSVTVSVALPQYDLENLKNQERTALQASKYDVTIRAKSEGDLEQYNDAELSTTIGQIYGAQIEIIGSESITSYPSTEVSEGERTEKFTFKLTNTGNKIDTITDNIIATTYPDEWEVELYQSSTCSSSFTGSVGAGQSKYLYLCVTPDQESDIGNYSILTEFSPGSGSEPAEKVTVNLEVASPERALVATAIDVSQEIYPEYEGTASQNSVKFKVKLANTGSNVDKYIPEVETTFTGNKADWEVTFWQDSSKTQIWPSSGVEIEDGELDDLWVFVQVGDEADEGNETIEISIRDEEDDPNARVDVSLEVVVQRPEILVQTSAISLEVDGVEGNASSIKDGATVVVLVDVENTGSADADDVRVEVYYYPKKAPTESEVSTDPQWTGFVFDESENTYIYVLYDKETNIKSGNKKSIQSDDWVIEGGEWYVEVRADYDDKDSNGKILEPNENNNDNRYSELLRVKPDLSIDSMRVDSKFAGSNPLTPNVDDIVTFTVSVSNKGAADVDDARLYITADSSTDNEILKERSNKNYVTFDLDAGETTDVRFRWKATEDEWSSFRSEINPVCEDYDIDSFACAGEGDGFSTETKRMFDELGRYTNNEYPTTGLFEQSGNEVKFEVLPDFKIKKVVMDPRTPEVGENVEITVTLENIGNSDWTISSKPLTVIFEDGTGTELSSQVGESINKDDSVEVKFSWTVPDEDKETLQLTYKIDAGSGSFEIKQCNTCDELIGGNGKDNDEYEAEIDVILPAVLGEIESITYLTERELIRGVPLIIPVVGLFALLALSIPVLMLRRRGGGAAAAEESADDSEGDSSDEVGDEDEETPAPPTKIGVAIVSTLDGKTANVKVPSNMPVNKLLQNCVSKFPLPHPNFAVMLNGVPVDLNLTLQDAGLIDGCQVDLVPLE